MNFTEMLQFVNNLVYTKTGKHLDDTQTNILKGIFTGQEYADIAEQIYKSEGHVRNIASKLFQNISDAAKENPNLSKSLQETINKSNFCSAMERLNISKSFNEHNNNVGNNSQNVKIYNNNFPPSEVKNTPSPPEQKNINLPIQDLKKAPIIKIFYGRKTEINTLKDYIFNHKYHLISILGILGILGIGKTTLIGKLVNEIQADYEIVIWHKIEINKPFNHFISEILKIIDNTEEIPDIIEEKINLFIDILHQHKSLIIIDQIENLFIEGQFSGYYQTEHINYKTLWEKIIKEHHKSCVILISNEKPKEIITAIELNKQLVGILELKGLKEEEGKELFKEKQLKDENHWTQLINMYQGNPLWLNYITIMINEVCEGKVGELVGDNQINLPDDLAIKINEIYQRLSEIEKQILEAIATSTLPITRSELQKRLSLSKNDIFNGIQSLIRRYLVVKIAEKETRYNILEILREFIISQ